MTVAITIANSSAFQPVRMYAAGVDMKVAATILMNASTTKATVSSRLNRHTATPTGESGSVRGVSTVKTIAESTISHRTTLSNATLDASALQ
eukprot:3089137-Prymnesium_polylepis.1